MPISGLEIANRNPTDLPMKEYARPSEVKSSLYLRPEVGLGHTSQKIH
jgi:hypothetical protein